MFFKRLLISAVCLVSFAQVRAAGILLEECKILIRKRTLELTGKRHLDPQEEQLMEELLNVNCLRMAMYLHVGRGGLSEERKKDPLSQQELKDALFITRLTKGRFGNVRLR